MAAPTEGEHGEMDASDDHFTTPAVEFDLK
jgi:hypothetical protein